MIAHSHYDRETLGRFLDNATEEANDEIAAHVEQCETCQATLESLLSEGLTIEEAGDLLSEPDGAGFVQQATGDSKMAAPGFLEPTEHPGSLGRFARYEVMEMLGRGGMGIVMRGYDPSLNRHSAIKVLAPELASSAAARQRFSREAKSAAAVVHPHVVPIQTVDEHDGLPYLVMPVVEGRSVQGRVADVGPMDWIEAVRIAAQVASGLAAAHDQGLVHRDIKPANVLLERGVERVQITDFGLARAIDDASMTRSGVIAGTPQYMSPEQAHGDTIDHRSDLFSLGSLIYFMLTGHSPFRAETTMGVLNRIANDQPRSIRAVNASVPKWLEAIVMRLLAKPAEERYPSAAEVARLLEGCLAHAQDPHGTSLPAAAPTRSVSGTSSSWWGKGLVVAGLFAGLIYGGIVILLDTRQGTIRIESNVDNVPLKIMQGDKVVKELTVARSGTQVRVAAGEYVIQLSADVEAMTVDRDTIVIDYGETETISITELADAGPNPKSAISESESATAEVAAGDGAETDGDSNAPAQSVADIDKPREDASPPDVIQPGETVGVHIPGILFAKNPPITTLPSGETFTGFPLVVASDGTIRLPYHDPIEIGGLTIREAESKIGEAYVKSQILRRESSTVLLAHGTRADPSMVGQEIKAGQTIAIILPGILPADTKAQPPITQLASGEVVTGFPLVVASDGTLRLPHVERITVAGLSVREAEDKIAKVMIEKRILREELAFPILTRVSTIPESPVIKSAVNAPERLPTYNGMDIREWFTKFRAVLAKTSIQFPADALEAIQLLSQQPRNDSAVLQELDLRFREIKNELNPSVIRFATTTIVAFAGRRHQTKAVEMLFELADLRPSPVSIEDLHWMDGSEEKNVTFPMPGIRNTLHRDRGLAVQIANQATSPNRLVLASELLWIEDSAVHLKWVKDNADVLLPALIDGLNDPNYVVRVLCYQSAFGIRTSMEPLGFDAKPHQFTRRDIDGELELALEKTLVSDTFDALSKNFAASIMVAIAPENSSLHAALLDWAKSDDHEQALGSIDMIIERPSYLMPIVWTLLEDEQWGTAEVEKMRRFEGEFTTYRTLLLGFLATSGKHGQGGLKILRREANRKDPRVSLLAKAATSAIESASASGSSAPVSRVVPMELPLASSVNQDKLPEWDDLLNLLPATGSVLVMFHDGSDDSERMVSVAQRVADAASVKFIQVPQSEWRKVTAPPATHFVLMKDRQLVATRSGLLTNRNMTEFVATAKDWLTPISTSVNPGSLARIDCFISPGRDNIGSQYGSVYPLCGAIVAQHGKQTLIIGPDSIAEYLEGGYACLIAIRDAEGKTVRYPMDVVNTGPVPLKPGGDAMECDAAVYLVEGLPELPTVRLAPDNSVAEGDPILTASFDYKRHRPPIHYMDVPIFWQSQRINSVGASIRGSLYDGARMNEVHCPSLPAAIGLSFNSDGLLVGRAGLGSPDAEDPTYSVFARYTIRAVLRAAAEKVEDEGLLKSLQQTIGGT